jgi:hypothetical protein
MPHGRWTWLYTRLPLFGCCCNPIRTHRAHIRQPNALVTSESPDLRHFCKETGQTTGTLVGLSTTKALDIIWEVLSSNIDWETGVGFFLVSSVPTGKCHIQPRVRPSELFPILQPPYNLTEKCGEVVRAWRTCQGVDPLVFPWLRYSVKAEQVWSYELYLQNAVSHQKYNRLTILVRLMINAQHDIYKTHVCTDANSHSHASAELYEKAGWCGLTFTIWSIYYDHHSNRCNLAHYYWFTQLYKKWFTDSV